MYENLGRFPYTVHKQLIAATEQFAQSELADPDRHLVSNELSEQINRHRYLQDANWSLPTEILDALESNLNKLKPRNCVLQNVWLFDQWPDRFYQRRSGSYQEHQQALETARDEAIREIIDTLGFDGVQSLIEQAEAPGVVGAVVARVSADQFIAEVIPQQIPQGHKGLEFAGGFIWGRFRADGWNWVDAAIDRCATDDDRAWVLVPLPFEPETWQRADAAGDSVRRLYWQRCRAWNHELNEPALRSAVESLVQHSRPADAIDLLAMEIHQKKEIATETLLLPLESLLQLDGEVAWQQIKRADAHDIGELIEALQEREDVDLARLIRIEWNFLGVLDEHSGRAPKRLHRHLCESPKFFVELLTLLYRSKHEPENGHTTTSADDGPAAIANQAWRLLHDWKLLPGTKDDGSIDEDILRTWCDEARRLATDCGRTEVCDSHLGQLFAHAPNDTDGKWPCTAVQRVIESVATESLGSGLHCGICNLRGVVWRAKGGDQERELAAKYRQQADAIRFDAPFTAEVLDSVARSYENEAREWDERDRWEE